MSNELALRPSLVGRPHHGLESPWDMYEFQASEFVDALRAFSAVEALVENKVEGSDGLVNGESVQHTLLKLSRLENACNSLGAVITADFVRDAKMEVEAETMKWTELTGATKQIYAVLVKELARTKLFSISPHEAELFENATNKFSIEVVISFPSALADIDEAGKCFALGRHTACVFHLMRVLEVPLQTLSKVLLPDDPKPNWDPVLRKIDEELKLPYKQRRIKGNSDFFAGVSSHMHAVKLAWRNRVMHVDTIMPEDRVKAIFDAVVGLMDHLATRLTEEGEFLPDEEPLLPLEAKESE
jgi:hypothetical protein